MVTYECPKDTKCDREKEEHKDVRIDECCWMERSVRIKGFQERLM